MRLRRARGREPLPPPRAAADVVLLLEAAEGEAWAEPSGPRQRAGDCGGVRGHEAAPTGARRGEARDVGGVGEHAGQYLKEDVVGQSGQQAAVIVVGSGASVVSASDPLAARPTTTRQPPAGVRRGVATCAGSSQRRHD